MKCSRKMHGEGNRKLTEVSCRYENEIELEYKQCMKQSKTPEIIKSNQAMKEKEEQE